MMVHVGEAQVLEGHVLQLLHRLVGRELAALHLVEQLLDGVRFHGDDISFKFQVSSFKFQVDTVAGSGVTAWGWRISLGLQIMCGRLRN